MMRAIWKTVSNALLAAGISLTAGAAMASVHGCRGIEDGHFWSSIEGRDGVFFRVDPGLHAIHPMTDATIAELARLSRALKAAGTTLVLAPLPTKALAMPRSLDLDTELFGYDTEIATTVYLDAIGRLRGAGITTADALRPLIRSEQPPYFKTDYRMNARGAAITAATIGQEIRSGAGYAQQARHSFTTIRTGQADIPSAMRIALQQHCEATLPKATTEIFETRIETRAAQGQSGVIALVGTEFSDLPEANFAGFLAQETGFDVIQYSLPGGGAFGAISTYLTSEEFATGRPDFLVWEFPIYDNPGGNGLQPLEELIAAAFNSCRDARPLELADPETQPGVATADLSALATPMGHSLLLETGGAPARTARFAFDKGDGIIRTKIIARHPEQLPTGRFFVPLSGLWPDGADKVDITLDVAFGDAPSLSVCSMGDN
ncbi:hypothetical protein PGB28_20435 [Primorskyibacter aestuariivivens]|uniref:alginate O-acetyltransferase AlgX-related protein n=1 Tax=Primorskyibacter aestuariivivens TaxID=1888912 RepID=UPI002301731D|nr:hypothetical protein [Primorskyibacter aestuariivivens]MDA7430836.1 hypothetical protein [Primorskyibacter aestuariivivens]